MTVLTLPAFSAETVDVAIETYYQATLRPVLIHAPAANGKCTCGQEHKATGKHPIVKNWQKPATLDELQDQLARLRFTPNVGLVLGEQQNGEYIVAVDVDDVGRLLALEAILGPLPETARCDSGRGYRLFYELGSEIAVDTVRNITGLQGAPGVDVKVRGGQVVVSPSMHSSGKRYIWSRVGAIATLPASWGVELVHRAVPEWVKNFTPQTLQADKRALSKLEKWVEKAISGNCKSVEAATEGTRNTTLHKCTIATLSACSNALLPGTWWDDASRRLAESAKRAGLTEHETKRTIRSAQDHVRSAGLVRVPVPLFDPGTGPHSIPPGSPPGPTSAPPGSPPSSRPVIRITTELHHNVDESVQALKSDLHLYQRDGKLSHVIRVTREQSSKSPVVSTENGVARHALVEGSPQIVETSIATLRERLTRFAEYEKWNERASGWKGTLPTDHIVSAVHVRGEWPVRMLVGVTETPTLRPDGSVVQDAGYDAATGYLYQPSETFPRVPESPSQLDAVKALRDLLEIFEEFPYVKSKKEAHQSVPVAAILTLIARPAILGAVPAFVFNASTRGSGKTLQTDVIAMIVSGRMMPRMSYPAQEEELEKVLGSYAIRGAQFFSLDNINRPFGGDALERVVTARDTVELRVLGENTIPTLSWRAVVFATGNNVDVRRDMVRRTLIARLEPDMAEPEKRTGFKHGDLPAWVKENRGRLVVSALTVLRAYFFAKKPDQGCDHLGSFEEWSRLIPHAIVWAGGKNPMDAQGGKDSEVDEEARMMSLFMREVIRLVPGAREGGSFKVSDLINLLFRTPRQKLPDGTIVADGFDELREAITEICQPRPGLSPDARQLGKRMARYRGRIIDGLKLDTRTGEAGILRWFVRSV